MDTQAPTDKAAPDCRAERRAPAPSDISEPAAHLDAGHPVASVAAGHCTGHTAALVGGIACGACWERAIRDDERFAVKFGLPRHLEPDATTTGGVDAIAVDRACAGETMPLTDAELAVAIRRLRRSGLTLTAIAARLRASERVVARETLGIPRGRQACRGKRGGGVAA